MQLNTQSKPLSCGRWISMPTHPLVGSIHDILREETKPISDKRFQEIHAKYKRELIESAGINWRIIAEDHGTTYHVENLILTLNELRKFGVDASILLETGHGKEQAEQTVAEACREVIISEAVRKIGELNIVNKTLEERDMGLFNTTPEGMLDALILSGRETTEDDDQLKYLEERTRALILSGRAEIFYSFMSLAERTLDVLATGVSEAEQPFRSAYKARQSMVDEITRRLSLAPKELSDPDAKQPHRNPDLPHH